LLKIKTLKRLDLRFNKLTQFDPEFNEQIKLGLDVEYEGAWLKSVVDYINAVSVYLHPVNIS
jgi:hypothetical protein